MRKIGIGELRLLLMSREFLEPLARRLTAGEADYMIPFLVELAEDDNDLLPQEPELFIAREEFRKALSRYLPDWVQVVALRNGFNREGWLALAALKDGEGLVDVLRQIADGAEFRTLNGKAREVWRRPSTRERTNAAVALRQIAEAPISERSMGRHARPGDT